jgi:hypothetical protein
VVLTYVVTSLASYRGWSTVPVTALGATTGALALASSDVAPPRVRLAFATAVLATLLAALYALGAGRGFLATAALIQGLLLLIASGAVLRAVLTALEVNFKTILGAISVYMIFGFLFTLLYATLDRLEGGGFFIQEQGSHTGDFVFFSFTTLTTTGYGNLVPADQPGKMFAGLEMLLGQIFLVTLIAGLVSLWRPRRP